MSAVRPSRKAFGLARRDVSAQAIGQIGDDRGRERAPDAVGRRRRAVGQLRATAVRVEGALAAQAVADAVVDLAVVDLVEAEPVEEEAVDRVAVDDLVERGERFLLVVGAARADAEQAADGLRSGRSARRSTTRDARRRCCVGDLGEVHARHQAQPARVRAAHGVAEQVATGPLGEVRIARLERQVGGKEGEDAAGVDQPDIGAVRLDVVEDALDVEGGVDFAQVGLEHAERPAPPGRGARHGRARRAPEGRSSPRGRRRACWCVVVKEASRGCAGAGCKRYRKLSTRSIARWPLAAVKPACDWRAIVEPSRSAPRQRAAVRGSCRCGSTGRFAHDERRLERHAMRQPRLIVWPGQLLQQDLRALATHLLDGVGHAGERRNQESGELQVVLADDGDIVGHAQIQVVERFQHGDGVRVVVGDDGGRPLPGQAGTCWSRARSSPRGCRGSP